LKHIPELDGLRAFAVGAVILDHTIEKYFPGGFIGVDVFFVLSGYLITRILTEEYAQSGDIKLLHFYIRRVLRLMPALWTMLLVYVAVLHFDHRHMLAASYAFFYLTNIIPNNGFGPSGYLGHTWSLGIEEQFYLLWPVALFALLRYGKSEAKFVLVAILIVMAWRTLLVANGVLEYTYHSFDTRSDQLLIGCLLAIMPNRQLRFVAIPVLVLTALLFISHYKSPYYLLLGIPLIGVCAAWLISVASNGGNNLFCRVLRWEPVNYCGRISYGIYLWHAPIAEIARQIHPSSIWMLAFTVVLTVPIASISYFVIEKPAITLRRYLRPIDKEGDVPQLWPGKLN
jgi:peptidoglycan/LPS O-acetylase OafA/YrhL